MKKENYQSPQSEVQKTRLRASLLQSSIVSKPGQQEGGENADPDARIRHIGMDANID